MKLKNYLNYFMINVKYIETHADTEPRNWENYCMMLGVFGLLLYPTLAYGSKLFIYENYLFIKGFFWLLFALGGIPYGIRATMSIGILLYKKSLPAFGDGLSGIFFGAAAVCWKLKKPILAGCFGCLGSVCGASDLFQSRYQFSPMREFWLAFDQHQTWDQAKEHVLNPAKYSGTNIEPYLQDKLQKAAQIEHQNEVLRAKNQALQKALDDALRKK